MAELVTINALVLGKKQEQPFDNETRKPKVDQQGNPVYKFKLFFVNKMDMRSNTQVTVSEATYKAVKENTMHKMDVLIDDYVMKNQQGIITSCGHYYMEPKDGLPF